MIKVNLVGNPNTGKTTLFNCLTGANEHVGNWHGVTVEEKAKIFSHNGKQVEIVDLPGIYSLTALSYEEEVAIDYIRKSRDNIFLNICDASNLQRNLYLTLCLLEFGVKVILAVNTIEKRPICKVDYGKLEKLLGLPVIVINPSTHEGIDKLKDALCSCPDSKASLDYLKGLHLQKIKSNQGGLDDFLAVKALEYDKKMLEFFGVDTSALKPSGEDLTRLAAARYDYIDSLLRQCASKRERVYGQSRADKILLNKFLALPIFFCILALVFYLTFFSLGRALSDCFAFLLDRCVKVPFFAIFGGIMPEWLSSFFENALFGGAGMVLGFLPQVALLFFFLSLLEDSGYLSRIAFLADDILSKVGLSGKSIYTLLMGFGCSTTAVLTARNMENKKSKIKTALLTPYMSCSAKFPIYAVIGGAFFGANNIFVIMALYFLGAFVSILLSFLFEKTVLKSGSQTFILEFPPYHAMSLRRTCRLLWQNIKEFLSRVGTIIIAMNVIVWILSNFSFSFRWTQNGGGSILESLGKVLSPIFAPIGFSSWGLVSALLAGLIAKEVILSSVCMFAGVQEGALAAAFSTVGSAVFFPSQAAVLSYLVFCLLYFPCLANVGVLSHEIGKKWTAFGCVVQLLVAYLVAFAVYRFALFGIGYLFILPPIFVLAVLAISTVIKKVKSKDCAGCARCHKSCKK